MVEWDIDKYDFDVNLSNEDVFDVRIVLFTEEIPKNPKKIFSE